MNLRVFICICAFIAACNGFSLCGRTQYQIQSVKATFEKFQLRNKRYGRVSHIESIKFSKQMKLQFLQLIGL